MMHRYAHLLLGTLLLTGCGAQTPLVGTEAEQSQQLVEARTGIASTRHRVLILFDRPAGEFAPAALRALGGQVHRVYHLLPAAAAEIPEGAIDDLASTPGVLAIDLDAEVHLLDAELDSAWGVAHIGADTLHATGNRGEGVRVAIVDTGIDYRHPDLDGNYAGGWDFVYDTADPMDEHGHGTHVSGTIGAEDNDVGVVGVAPLAQLYALRVLDASGSGSWSRVLAALEWAVDANIKVANHSYGSGVYPGTTVEQAFAQAELAGLLNIAAAGNGGSCTGSTDTITYPAAFSSVLAVGAVDRSDVRPCFSATGPALDLVAPGVDITSTTLVSLGSYGSNQGTSMAAPHATGAAALALGAGVTDGNGNGRVNDELRERLLTTTADLGAAGWDPLYGYGLVNAARAATLGGSPPPTPPPASLAVASVQYVASGRNLWVLISVATSDQLPVVGANVTASIYRSGKLLTTRVGSTDANGAMRIELRNVKSGCYETKVTTVAKTGFVWDGVTPANSVCR